jgi:hypothetical protein
MFFAIINNAVVFEGATQQDCIAFFNSNISSLKQGDKLFIAQVAKTGMVTVQITV